MVPKYHHQSSSSSIVFSLSADILSAGDIKVCVRRTPLAHLWVTLLHFSSNHIQAFFGFGRALSKRTMHRIVGRSFREFACQSAIQIVVEESSMSGTAAGKETDVKVAQRPTDDRRCCVRTVALGSPISLS